VEVVERDYCSIAADADEGVTDAEAGFDVLGASPNMIMCSSLCLVKTSRPVKLSDFPAHLFRKSKDYSTDEVLGRRSRPFRLSATREDRDPARTQCRL
jgi:hypothetical protein